MSEATVHAPSAEHDPNSSSSTLVNHGQGSPAPEPSTPASPFSSSFDPNGPAPTVQQHALAQLYPISEVRMRPAAVGVDASALWANRLSASFGAIADQIAAASRALAVVPDTGAVGTIASGVSTSQSQSVEAAALAARLDVIERTQEKLGEDLQAMQTQLARLQVGANGHGARDWSSGSGKGHEGDVTVVEVQDEGTGEFKSATEMAIEELQKKVDGVVETIKLDQARLYARLHNATVTTNKMAIKAPMTANGKPPVNFPNTKGEFEHLTKERYEQILKSYNVPIKGDTNAKREALREFIGLTPPS